MCQFRDGIVGKGFIAAIFEFAGKASAEIDLDQRPAQGPQIVGRGRGAVGAAEQTAVRFEFLRIAQRQKKFVGKPQWQAGRSVCLAR